MKQLFEQIKEYWFLIVFIFGGVAAIMQIVGNSYVIEVADGNLRSDAAKQYISELIRDEIADAKALEQVNGTLAVHETKIDNNSKDNEMTRKQLNDVARILMEN